MSKSMVLIHPQFGEIRGVMIKGELYFAMNDVCRVIGITNPRAAKKGVDREEMTKAIVYTHGGNQELNVISKFGVYQLAFLSRKRDAKEFRKWLFAKYDELDIEKRESQGCDSQKIVSRSQKVESYFRPLRIVNVEKMKFNIHSRSFEVPRHGCSMRLCHCCESPLEDIPRVCNREKKGRENLARLGITDAQRIRIRKVLRCCCKID